MRVEQLHRWDVSPAEAVALQKELRGRVTREDSLGALLHVAGIDVGFEAGGTVTRAAVAVLSFPALTLCDHALARRPTSFPYVPGLLSFREIPAVLDALERIRLTPELLLCDGQGIAHPRRFGIACHLGVLTNLPSIGVAKSRLLGRHEPVPDRRGAWTPLHDDGECIGAVLRTREHVKPVYVSVGHRLSLPTAIDLVLRCTPRFRLPETTRLAHRLASVREP
jgi:deoxyribonuclease V